MSSKPVKTVSVTCACGVSFTREVKRGRPQVWCAACLLVPFYERTFVCTVPVVSLALEATLREAEGLPPMPERIVNENDRLDDVRAEIEAAMVLINADHKVRFEALVAGGVDRWAASAKAQADTLAATQNLYAQYGPKWYTPGREIEE